MAFQNSKNFLVLSTLLLASLLSESPRFHVEGRTMQTREAPTTVEPDIKEFITQSPKPSTINAQPLVKTETDSKASARPTTIAQSVTEATTVTGSNDHINLETER